MSGCDEVDVMTVANIESNIDTSSNPGDVSNIIPKTGTADYWSPLAYDNKPTIRVTLQDVNGIPPTDYEVMTIKIKANNFVTVNVTVAGPQDNIVFTVSFVFVWF